MKKIQKKQKTIEKNFKKTCGKFHKDKEDKNRLEFENYLKFLVCVKKVNSILKIKIT